MTIAHLNTIALTESARAVFKRIVQIGQTTRPLLGSDLDFSKPTMSAAIQELSSAGLVEPAGTTQGPTGRTATLYGLGREAGYVIGIDAGVTQVRAIAQTLDGNVLAEVEKTFPVEGGRLTAKTGRAIRSVLTKLREANTIADKPLRAISLALPVIVSRNHPELASGLDIVKRAIGDIGEENVVLENNVNCAAIAELDKGGARGRTSFAYLQVGVNIGVGLVHEGRLFRGANGAAGEVTRLPFPWNKDAQPTNRGLENYMSSHSLMERVREDWKSPLPAPSTPRDLFLHAEAGSAEAIRHIERHAHDIGLLAAAVVSIYDPGLIVLGGGVGQNRLLIPIVKQVIAEFTWPTEVITSRLPARGTVLGASQLAVRQAVFSLTGSEHLPRAD